MGANFGDLDNDGWLDIYLGDGEPAYEALLPNRMFRNKAGKDFQDVTTNGGFGHLQKGPRRRLRRSSRTTARKISSKRWAGAFPGDTYQSVLYQNPLRGNRLDNSEARRAWKPTAPPLALAFASP